jgi:hypothetical protein
MYLARGRRGRDRVVLFAAIDIVVRRCARFVDLIAKGVVLIGVCHCSGGVGQLANTARTVVAVEARRPRTIDDLILADALQPIRVSVSVWSGKSLEMGSLKRSKELAVVCRFSPVRPVRLPSGS